VTPSLTTGTVIFSLLAYIAVYGTFGSFGLYYIYRLLREGPSSEARAIPGATANRPMAFAGDAQTATGGDIRRRE
jgi:cytochrome bd ubiquinol oxidase subunit I